MKSGYTDESFYSPLSAAKQLKAALPKGEAFDVNAVALENILKEWVSTGSNDHIESSEVYWVFYMTSETGNKILGAVDCRTGQTDLIELN